MDFFSQRKYFVTLLFQGYRLLKSSILFFGGAIFFFICQDFVKLRKFGVNRAHLLFGFVNIFSSSCGRLEFVLQTLVFLLQIVQFVFRHLHLLLQSGLFFGDFVQRLGKFLFLFVCLSKAFLKRVRHLFVLLQLIFRYCTLVPQLRHQLSKFLFGFHALVQILFNFFFLLL